ncbi:hypothetical protein EH165_00960 [Nakamurella antarctica]|uniref:Terminase large subunit gp17-like C-terminal domain-containing protein n=1 Tax=Nakamurella antarctica TaxID=1902245 RepID=A0A3G8ZT39_9ACTN|nr:hypothetical protein [Nakamurella antarctica]AZI56951.1 hypothetical protein EH165_00960 [Nakamurella antarctica]
MAAYTIGLDLGQAQDYSALAVVEHLTALPPGYSRANYAETPHLERIPHGSITQHHVRYLKKWPLGTSYPQVVDETAEILRHPRHRYHANTSFRFDATGVGRAVKDLFWEKYRAGEMNQNTYRAITITSTIKRNMGDAVVVPLQRGRLKIATGLLLGDVLERELASFRQKVSASGNTTYDTDDKDGHGDLATALMLAMLYLQNISDLRLVDHDEQ